MAPPWSNEEVFAYKRCHWRKLVTRPTKVASSPPLRPPFFFYVATAVVASAKTARKDLSIYFSPLKLPVETARELPDGGLCLSYPNTPRPPEIKTSCQSKEMLRAGQSDEEDVGGGWKWNDKSPRLPVSLKFTVKLHRPHTTVILTLHKTLILYRIWSLTQCLWDKIVPLDDVSLLHKFCLATGDHENMLVIFMVCYDFF